MAEIPKATERQARTPLPRPDSDPPQRRYRGPRMQVLLIILGLLAANYIFVALFAPGKEDSVRIPYSPTFLQEVRVSNVDRISAEGATVEGEFKKDFKYEDNAPVKNFTTEIPIFANSDQLSQLLESKGVRIEAEPINQNRGILASLILGFGPVILLIGLFVFLARRAGSGRRGAGSAPGCAGSRRSRSAPPSARRCRRRRRT